MKHIAMAVLMTVGVLSAQGGITVSTEAPEPPPPYIPTTNHYNIVFDDVPMIDVVREFTRAADANIIATPADLNGTVTVNFRHVEWRPALESILEMYNLALQEHTPNSGVFQIVHGPDYSEPYVYEPTLADIVSDCMPTVVVIWLLALLFLNPLFSIAVFRSARRVSPQSRPLGGPALWTYAVLVGGLPLVIIFWWIHRRLERKETANH